jgi:hypothetical protein
MLAALSKFVTGYTRAHKKKRFQTGRNPSPMVATKILKIQNLHNQIHTIQNSSESSKLVLECDRKLSNLR